MEERILAGRYRLEENLGGTMGEVYLATDVELGRRIVVKLLGTDADPQRFEREARAAASLAHPNIVQLFSYGDVDGRPYMVFEYLPGGSLEERLADGRPLPDAATSRIARDIAAGLAHAHARGLVHRDLKPANVLFDEEGRAKIADFGIARLSGAGTLTEAGTVLGTAAYISPEQASGEKATPASDVYSFGVILFRMLTGRPPFVATEPMQLVELHRSATPPSVAALRADAPGRLESVAAAALAKNPRDRPENGPPLVAELGGGAGDETTALAVAADAGPRRSPVAVAAASAVVALLALAGIGFAVALTHSNSSPPTPSIVSSTKRHRTTTQAPAVPTEASTKATTTRRATTRARPTVPAPTTQPATTAPPPTTEPTTTAPPPPPPPTTTTTATTQPAPGG